MATTPILTETPTPTPTVTETPTETTTTTLPSITEVPKQNYIEFNSYEITSPTKARLDKSIRIYNGMGSNYFPFVSVIVVRRGRERINYYELINSNGQTIFITDEEGLLTLFDNNIKSTILN